LTYGSLKVMTSPTRTLLAGTTRSTASEPTPSVGRIEPEYTATGLKPASQERGVSRPRR
jgi:hypothetical protein